MVLKNPKKNLLYVEWINNKVLLYSTRNYSQYPVRSHNGKEYKRECIYVQLSHCAGQQKLTHYKQLHFNFFLKKIGCTILKNNLWR